MACEDAIIFLGLVGKLEALNIERKKYLRRGALSA